ncbi:MAG: OmpA family protein, partial [Psychrobacter sp.]|nr:OmpA family protein [Psychrobacter sp.]
LFEFDKSAAQNVLPQGQRELADLAQKLRNYQQLGETRIIITGHTDRKGDDNYNMNLSLKRAQTIRSYLISQGIESNNMIATGAGETQPVQQCSTALPRLQEIDCLQPNRRVTVDVTVIQ